MYVGHYAPALALRARYREVPLWALFLAVQAVDILFFVLVPLGIERMAIDPSRSGFLALRLLFMPWSHSLALTALYGVVIALVMRARGQARTGIALGLGVVSHWVCDLLVHTPDLPLAPGAPSVGFGLWAHRELAFAVEIALLLASFALLRPQLAPKARRNVLVLTGVLVLVQTLSTFVLPVPGSVMELAIASEVSYVAFAVFAWWAADRDRPPAKA
jgi:hypothetical protein